MTHTYTFERGRLPDGHYAIEHPERLTPEGEQRRIAREIEAAFPGLVFHTVSTGDVFDVHVERELTVAEQATLTAAVETHKANG